jgi:DNA-directed RNA polymerase specialized sigma24 family protein
MDRTKFQDLPNQTEFDALSEMIFSKVKEYINHDALAKEITSEIQIGLVKEEIKDLDLETWIKKRVETHTESYISDLWDYCFSYAMKLLENPDIAQDITQTVMVSLLQSQHEITYVKGWLKQSVYNQCMLTFKGDKKLQELGNKLKDEPKPALDTQKIDEEQLEKKLTDADIKRLLSKPEYLELREMRSYKTFKDYAQSKGINYGAARKRKHCILTNLKASYLNEQGWVNIPEVLDYRTLVNVKRFMSTLVEKNRLGDYKQLYHYCTPEMVPALSDTLKNTQVIFDWGISQISPKHYQVSICDITNNENPNLVVVEIAINRANYIRITDCYGSALLGVIQESKLDRVPSDKGKCLLTPDDVYKYTH